MYCGPQGNRIYSWLLTKKLHHCYLGTFFTVIVLFSVWAIFFYQPFNCIIEGERQNIISAQERFVNGAVAQKKCQELEQKLKESKQLIESVTQKSARADQDYLVFLVEHAQQAGLAFCSCSRAYKDKQEGLEICSLNCRMRGTVDHLLRFFDTIVQSCKHIGCSHFSIVCDSDKQSDISCSFDYVV